MPRSRGKRLLSACVFRAGRAIAGETRSPARVAGEGPRATVKKRAADRRARACPSPCLGREENGFCLRAIFAQVGCSRGTGPRATVKKHAAYCRARACPSPCLDREENGLCLHAIFARVGRSRGTGPRATVKKGPADIFSRGCSRGKPARLRVWQARAPALR